MSESEENKSGLEKPLDAEPSVRPKVAAKKPAKSTAKPAAKENATAPEPVLATKPNKPQRRSGGGFWILLALLLLAGSGYYLYTGNLPGMPNSQSLQSSLLETQQQTADLAVVIGSLQSRQNDLEQTLTDFISDQRDAMQRLTTDIEENPSRSPDEWLLAEARYLVRLAAQRLGLAEDAAGALQMMQMADEILRGLNQPYLAGARRALIEDMSRVRAEPRPDIDGIYFAIAGLTESVDRLPLRAVAGLERDPQVAVNTAEDSAFWTPWLAALSELVIVRKTGSELGWMADAGTENLLRANLSLLMTQASAALLAGDQAIYSQTLQRAHTMVERHFEPSGETEAVLDELLALADRSIQYRTPSIDRSLVAVEQLVPEVR